MKTRNLLAIAILAGSAAYVNAQPGPTYFQSMDTDGDGVLSEQEFTQAHQQRMAARAAQGRPMRNAANAPQFIGMDLNGDGAVQPEELMQYQQQRMQQRWQSMPGYANPMMGNMPGYANPMMNMPNRPRMGRPGFTDIDSNGDGCIDAEELSSFQQTRMAPGGMGMRGPGRGMGFNMPRHQEFDLNGDGMVDEEEFVEARGRRIEQRAKEGRMMRGLANMPSFADIDTDGDGNISAEEFAAHQASHRQMHGRMQQMMPGSQ